MDFPDFPFPPPAEQPVPWWQSAKFSQYFGGICFVISFLAYVIVRGGKVYFTRYYSVPPFKFHKHIEDAYNNSTTIGERKTGLKTASFRRRLIIGSVKPQLYSTVPLATKPDTNCADRIYQKIRIARVDKEDNPDFLELTKPIDPHSAHRKILYGFFHPYSYAGGGGERVLWQAAYITLKRNKRNVAVIYTFTPTNSTSVSTLLSDVHRTFGIDFFEPEVKDRVVFMQLPNKYRWIVDGRSFPFLTMAFQALGSLVLFFMAMNQCAPDIFIDTLGLPFSWIPAGMFMQIPVVAYVHYPWVSSDMLLKISHAMKTKPWLAAKYVYWYMFLKFYSICGSFLDVSFCNSTWTLNNLLRVWTWADSDATKPKVVYPPTGIDESKIKIDAESKRDKFFLYVAQFRPEKRHELLLREFAKYLKSGPSEYKLVLAGTTRSVDDENTVKVLKELVTELGIPEGSVVFNVNAPREQIDKYLSEAEFGLNTMWSEHFGITVVEYMVYGAIPIAHASAGPLLDIVVPIHPESGVLLTDEERYGTKKVDVSCESGFFFQDESDPDYGSTPEKYDSLSVVFERVTKFSESQKLAYRKNAMAVASKKFCSHVFEAQWTQITDLLALLESKTRDERGNVEQLY